LAHGAKRVDVHSDVARRVEVVSHFLHYVIEGFAIAWCFNALKELLYVLACREEKKVQLFESVVCAPQFEPVFHFRGVVRPAFGSVQIVDREFRESIRYLHFLFYLFIYSFFFYARLSLLFFFLLCSFDSFILFLLCSFESLFFSFFFDVDSAVAYDLRC